MKVDIDSYTREPVFEAILKLDAWIDGNGWAGYDPYDVRSTQVFLWSQRQALNGFLLAKVLRRGLHTAEDLFPRLTRSFLDVQRQINPKGLGLLAKGYLNLYQGGLGDNYLLKAKDCLDWLASHGSSGYPGIGWGYPFDWQSLVFIPKGTPSSVVSAVVGDAFWRAYSITDEHQYLDICIEICEFYVSALNIDRIDSDRYCFSYTPLDRMHVLNATLFVGEFLIRVGRECNRSEYVDFGIKVANYVVSNQNRDGSWYYFGSEDQRPKTIDHYHTGFMLRMLFSITRMIEDYRYTDAVVNGFEYYWNELFDSNDLPKFSPDSLYPINIHSVSEAILVLTTMRDMYPPERLSRLQKLVLWTLQNMQDGDGFFYYLRHKRRTSKLPMMRWAQAWMLSALSEVHTTFPFNWMDVGRQG